jgi:hypothetical protein
MWLLAFTGKSSQPGHEMLVVEREGSHVVVTEPLSCPLQRILKVPEARLKLVGVTCVDHWFKRFRW